MTDVLTGWLRVSLCRREREILQVFTWVSDETEKTNPSTHLAEPVPEGCSRFSETICACHMLVGWWWWCNNLTFWNTWQARTRFWSPCRRSHPWTKCGGPTSAWVTTTAPCRHPSSAICWKIQAGECWWRMMTNKVRVIDRRCCL